MIGQVKFTFLSAKAKFFFGILVQDVLSLVCLIFHVGYLFGKHALCVSQEYMHEWNKEIES